MIQFHIMDEILKHHDKMTNAADIGWCIDLAVHASEKHNDLKFCDVVLVTGEESQRRSEQLLFWMPYRRIKGWLKHLGYLMEHLSKVI